MTDESEDIGSSAAEAKPATPPSPVPTPMSGPGPATIVVNGARAAALIFAITTLLKFVIAGRIVYVEPGLAIALLMTEKDDRLQWVRWAVFAWVAWGLFHLVQATMTFGVGLGTLSGIAFAGGIAGLMFDDGDVRKIGAFFFLSLAGLLAPVVL